MYSDTDAFTNKLHLSADSKLDSKSNLHILNELAELNNCNVSVFGATDSEEFPLCSTSILSPYSQNTLYFEARKHQDLYLWASKTPNGPSAKLFVQNIHTMDELKMTGNCLKGSRPILSFDQTFDTSPHWSLLKEMFTQMFGVPRTSRRVKPFIDHVVSFSVLDGKIWFRNYQIVEDNLGAGATPLEDEEAEEGAGAGGKDGKRKERRGKKDAEVKTPTLVEIGPRFVMTPIKIFEGSFGGATLYENPEYISPNAVRHAQRRKKGEEYTTRSNSQETLKAKLRKLQSEKKEDPLAVNKVFA